MDTTASKNLGNVHSSAPAGTISPQSLQTLQDLLDALRVHEPEDSQLRRKYRQLRRMLVTTAGHVCMALGEPPPKIRINTLLDIKPKLRAHLMASGALSRHSVNSYCNYASLLVRRAKGFGWTADVPDIAAAWEEIARAASRVRGCVEVVRYAIRKGIKPSDFGERDLAGWAEAAIARGLRFEYTRKMKASFRRCIFTAELSRLLPNLMAPVTGRIYGIPISDFPEPLRSQGSRSD